MTDAEVSAEFLRRSRAQFERQPDRQPREVTIVYGSHVSKDPVRRACFFEAKSGTDYLRRLGQHGYLEPYE